MEDSKEIDELYVANTRPIMWKGVPVGFFMLNTLICGILFILVEAYQIFFIYGAAHLIVWQLFAHDPFGYQVFSTWFRKVFWHRTGKSKYNDYDPW